MKKDLKSVYRFGIVSASLPIIFLVIVYTIKDYLLIDYIHVLSAAFWLGCNLFMGFIFYRIIKDLDNREKVDITVRLLPLTLFFLPSITLTTVIAGYILAFYVKLFSYSMWVYLPIIIISTILLLLSFVYYIGNSISIIKILKGKSNVNRIISLSMINFKVAFVQLIFQVIIIGFMAYVVIIL
jgi:putative copper export protein